MANEQPAPDKTSPTRSREPSAPPTGGEPPAKLHAPHVAAELKNDTVICPRCETQQTTVANRTGVPRCSSCDQPLPFDEQPLSNDPGGSNQSPPTLVDFELIEPIGKGGFGTVWKAYDKNLNRLTAVKLPQVLKSDTDSHNRFVREAKLAAQLSHPNIVSIYELGEHDDGLFIVSEFVEGIALDEWKQRQLPSFDQIVTLCQKIALAADHAHKKGVIHRDLKPANILVDVHDEPHILDFGLGKGLLDEQLLTTDGVVIGTPAYMSPEQASGQANEAGYSSDIFSIGVILYELLTGELPFRGTREMLLHQILCEDPLPPSKLDRRIHVDLDTICLRCLDKTPERRFESAGQLSDELGRYLARIPIESRPIGPLTRAARWCGRNRLVASLTTAVFVSLLGGIVAATWFAVRASREARENSERSYVLGMNTVEQLVEDSKFSRAISLLESFRPHAGDRDLRRFEWQFWWDRCHDDELLSVPGEGKIRAIVRSSDNQQIAWSGGSGKIRICDATSFGITREIQASDVSVGALLFTADGESLISGDANGLILEWDLQQPDPQPIQLAKMDVEVAALAATQDGELIAAAGGALRSGALRLWQKGGTDFDIPGISNLFNDRIGDIDFSPDGAALALATFDGSIVVVDVKTGEERFVRSGRHFPGKVRFIDNHRIAYSVKLDGGFSARIADLHSKSEIKCDDSHQPFGVIGCVAVNSKLDLIAVGTSLGRLHLFSAQDGSLIHTYQRGSRRNLAVDIAPDGTHVVAGGDHSSLRVWKVPKRGADPAKEAYRRFAIGHPIKGVDLSGDETLLAAATANDVYVWNLAGRKLIATLDSLDSPSGSIRFAPDGHTLAVVTTSDVANVMHVVKWDFNTNECTRLATSNTRVTAIEFSPDGDQLAVGCGIMTPWPGEATVMNVVQLPDASHLFDCVGHVRSIVDIEYSADGTRIASAGSDRTIRFWDARSGQSLGVSRPAGGDRHSAYFANQLAFLPDNETIVAGYFDGTIVMADSRDGRPQEVVFVGTEHLKQMERVDQDTVIVTRAGRDSLAVFDLRNRTIRSELRLGVQEPRIVAGENLLVIGDATGDILVIPISDPSEE